MKTKSVAEQIKESKFLSKVFLSATKERYEKLAFVVLMSWAVAAPATLLAREHFYTYQVTVYLAVLAAVYWVVSKGLIWVANRQPKESPGTVLEGNTGTAPEEKPAGGSDKRLQQVLVKIKKLFFDKPWYFLLGGALVWSVLSYLVMCKEHRYIGFYGGSTIREGLLGNFVYALIYIFAVALSSQKRKQIILKVTAVGSLVLCFIFICQMIGYTNPVTRFVNRWVAQGEKATIYLNSNYYGYYLATMIPLTACFFVIEAKKMKSVLWLVLFSLNIWVLIQNNTMGAYVAVIGVLILLPVFYSIRKKWLHWKSFLPLLVFIAISLFCNYVEHAPVATNISQMGQDIGSIVTSAETAGSAGSGRWRLWQATVALIKEKPLFGCGPELMIPYLEPAIGYACRRPHNEYLQHAGMYGIPAGIMYLAALICIAVTQLKKLKKLPEITLIAGCAVIGYAISAFFGLTTFTTTPYLYLMLGMVSKKEYKVEL